MQITSSRIWTLITVSILYEDIKRQKLQPVFLITLKL